MAAREAFIHCSFVGRLQVSCELLLHTHDSTTRPLRTEHKALCVLSPSRVRSAAAPPSFRPPGLGHRLWLPGPSRILRARGSSPRPRRHPLQSFARQARELTVSLVPVVTDGCAYEDREACCARYYRKVCCRPPMEDAACSAHTISLGLRARVAAAARQRAFRCFLLLHMVGARRGCMAAGVGALG